MPTNPSRARSRTATSSTSTRTCMLEGIAIAAFATPCDIAYIFIRGEYHLQAKILRTSHQGSLRQRHLRPEGILGTDSTTPLLRPPRRRRLHLRRRNRPARSARRQARLAAQQAAVPRHRRRFAKPTVINNVETLACLPPIIENGAGLVQIHGHATSLRAPNSTACPATSTSPAATKMNWASPSTSRSTNSRRHEGRKYKSAFYGGISMGVLGPINSTPRSISTIVHFNGGAWAWAPPA